MEDQGTRSRARQQGRQGIPRPTQQPNQGPQPRRPFRNQQQASPPEPGKVFLNFRGDELPADFMQSLMMQLGKENIGILIERDELRGREPEHSFTRIEASKVALAIFSKRYAESEWCLDELVKMTERVNGNNLVVIPVFYQVSKNDVRTRGGEFGTYFRVTSERPENNREKIQKWVDSLTSIAGGGDNDGIIFSASGNQSDLIATIIKTVKVKLNMPTYWSTTQVFFTTLLVCIATALLDTKVFPSSAWIVGFPVIVAILWAGLCHKF